MWSDEAREAAAAARSKGSAKAAPYRNAVANFQAAAGKFMQGLAAHQTGTLDNLKSTSQMMAEHDRIWAPRPAAPAFNADAALHTVRNASDRELVGISKDQRQSLLSATLRVKSQQLGEAFKRKPF